jgi:hypothetical protein
VAAVSFGDFVNSILGHGEIGPRNKKGCRPLDGQPGFAALERSGNVSQTGVMIYRWVQNKKSLSSVSELKDGTQFT